MTHANQAGGAGRGPARASDRPGGPETPTTPAAGLPGNPQTAPSPVPGPPGITETPPTPAPGHHGISEVAPSRMTGRAGITEAPPTQAPGHPYVPDVPSAFTTAHQGILGTAPEPAPPGRVNASEAYLAEADAPDEAAPPPAPAPGADPAPAPSEDPAGADAAPYPGRLNPPKRHPAAVAPPRDRHQAILEAAKQVGSLLKRQGHPFALAGSAAVYAHGGSGRLRNDADFVVRREDAEAVAATLREAGLKVYEPPEDWLWKATCLGEDIDLLFELAHRPVTTDVLDRAVDLPLDSVHMPVLSATDLLWSLLASFSEHHCDFGAVLPIARALREKVDWRRIRDECGQDPMPAAFLYLLERLHVLEPGREPS